MHMKLLNNTFDTIRLFARFTKLNLKITLEYKLDRTLTFFAIFCRESVNVLVIYFILKKFISIKGWEMNEMLFLYSFLFLSYSLFVAFFTGIREFDSVIYSGEFDRLLIRPVGLLTQIICARMDHCAFLGHGAVGLILFIKTSASVGIQWTPTNILYYIVTLVGAAIIQASLFMLSSCFNFWAIRTTNLRNMIFFNSRRFAGYPISFYPALIQNLLIYVTPFAFVSYFPAQYFLRKPELSLFWDGFLYMTPIVGVAMFALVYMLWKNGLKHYSSSGTSMY
ncbi:ABC transporter permease [Clostridium sp. Bc-iso-3]|nr:ABC transporter permease [Clostridium sp. Bc-iso-3]